MSQPFSTCTWASSCATWTVRRRTAAADRVSPRGGAGRTAGARACDDAARRRGWAVQSNDRRSAGPSCRSAAASSPPPSRRRSGPSAGCWPPAGSVWRLAGVPPPSSALPSPGPTPAGSRTASGTSAGDNIRKRKHHWPPLKTKSNHCSNNNNNNNTQDDIYSAVIMTTMSLREFTRFMTCDECRTLPSGRRPSDQATWLGLWVRL